MSLVHLLLYARSLDIEDSIDGVHGRLVFRGFADQSLLIGEGDKGRCGEGSLFICD